MWDPQVHALESSYRILRYDTRGHGSSAVPAGPYTFDDLIGDVIGLLDALDVDRTNFVGLSLGGMTALGLALKCTDRLESITVANAAAVLPAEALPVWEGRISLAREQGMEPHVEPTIERWFTEPMRGRNEPVIDRIRDQIRATPVEGYAGCAAALMQLAFEPRLGKIGVPTLVIAGDQDPSTPAGPMREMHEAVPGSQFVLLEAAHLSNLEQPEAFTGALTEFLASV